MSTSTGNIFLTVENLAFAMPLILVCTVYAYFKYIPLKIGLPILAVIAFGYFIQSSLQAHRNKQLQNLDEGMVRELAGEEEADTAASASVKAKEAQKKKKKAQALVQQRLAAEKKKEVVAAATAGKKKRKGAATNSSNNTNQDDDGEDDDDVAMMTFVKGSRDGKKGN